MHSPSARVIIERGIAEVEVFRENIVVEVRDYDIQARGDNGRDLWTDVGRLCRDYHDICSQGSESFREFQRQPDYGQGSG